MPSIVSVLVAVSATAGCAPVCGTTRDATVPATDLAATVLGSANTDAIRLFVDERRTLVAREFWIGVVPGTSEQWGHHHAPPVEVEATGVRISEEFQSRLNDAFAFLQADTIRFILITGGSVDAGRADYNEALRGKEYLLSVYGRVWATGDLAQRIFVDPLAMGSATNLRNADKFTVDLGLTSNLVITTMPVSPALSVGDFTTQGFYFLYHDLSSFDSRCAREFGYTLGDFSLRVGPERGAVAILALAHCGLSIDRLRADQYGP